MWSSGLSRQNANVKRRRKSLGLSALEDTLGQGQALTNSKIAGTTATSRNAALSKAQEIFKMSQPPPTVSEESETPEGPKIMDSGRSFNLTRESKTVGMGGPRIVPKPFNKKNPNQREARLIGGPVRL